MSGRPKKSSREKDLTSRYFGGDWDEDRIDQKQRFSARNKAAEQEKIVRTALMRAEEEAGEDIDALPVGEVIQVFSLYSEVEFDGLTYLCVVRKTLTKVSDTQLVVGDRVRFRYVAPAEETDADAARKEAAPATNASDPPRPREAVIEQILPRR